LLICETLPLLRLTLKLCITGPSRFPVEDDPAWLGTTTNPLEEDEYLVLQAITTATATSARTANIQVNRVRILRFLSCERSYAVPAAANRVEGLFRGVDCHSFMYQECAGRANSRQQVRTAQRAGSCLKTVVSGQWSVKAESQTGLSFTGH
jgi:hypothetical protein